MLNVILNEEATPAEAEEQDEAAAEETPAEE